MADSNIEPAKIPGASLFVVFALPFPWPPPADIVAMRDAGSGLAVVWTYTGRIRIEGRDKQGLIEVARFV